MFAYDPEGGVFLGARHVRKSIVLNVTLKTGKRFKQPTADGCFEIESVMKNTKRITGPVMKVGRSDMRPTGDGPQSLVSGRGKRRTGESICLIRRTGGVSLRK